MNMEYICVKYLKPASAIATFVMVAFTIAVIWFVDDRSVKVIWLKGFWSYSAWMIGNFIVFKIYTSGEPPRTLGK